MEKNKVVMEDDTKEPVVHLIQHRLPWLALGLLGGFVATIVSSQFESLFSKNIHLVYFIPIIVYMADAVGTQTETIYIRNLAKRQIKFSAYLVKEFMTGSAMGLCFGIALGVFGFLWFRSIELALTVGIAMFVTVAVSPLLAVTIPAMLQKERTDPALGAGPFTTVIQDLISLLIYFLVASFIIFYR